MKLLVCILVLFYLFGSGANASAPDYSAIERLFYQQKLKEIVQLARRIEPRDMESSNKTLTALLIANACRLNYDWAMAAKWYKVAMDEHKKNWIWAAAYYAFSLKRMRFYKEAAKILSELPKAESPYLDARIHYHLGVCFEALSDSQAIYEFLRAASIDKTIRPMAYRRIASIYLREKKYREAYIIAIELLNQNIYDALAKKIFLKVYPAIKKHSLQTRYIYARLMFMDGKYKIALQVFREIKGATGLYWQARALTGMKRYSEALKLYKKLLKIYPRSSLSHYTLREMFRIYYYRTRRCYTGVKEISGLLKLLPAKERDYAAYVLYILSKKLSEKSASRWVNYLIKNYPKSKYARILARELGLKAYFSGRYKEAIRYFKIADYYYWIALCYRKLGSVRLYQKFLNKEVRRDPTGYYATLLETRFPLVNLKDKYRNPIYWEEKAGFVEAAFNRYRQELVSFKDTLQTYYRLSLLSALFGNYRQSMGFAYLYIMETKRNTPEDIWHLYLPKTIYWKYIDKQSNKLHLNPYLVLALIKHESSFDPLVVSHANAIGLMQLLPRTAKAIARKSVNLFDPRTNITLGTLYLYYKLKRLKRLEWAVASYNAGEKVVRKWVAKYKAKRKKYSPVEWIESISYTETRNYVKRVLASYHLYRMIYQMGGIVNDSKK